MSIPPTVTRAHFRRYRRTSLAAVLALAASFTAVASVPSPASADNACPTDGIAFTTQFTNGTVKIGRLAPATGASISACGSAAVDADQVMVATMPAANMTFAPLSVPVGSSGRHSLPVQITPVADFSGAVNTDFDGLHITLAGKVVADIRYGYSKCRVGPFPMTLTTEPSGELAGVPLFPGPEAVTGKLVGNEDPVPAIHHSARCPLPVARMLNSLAGLPAAAGASAFTFDAAMLLSPVAATALNR